MTAPRHAGTEREGHRRRRIAAVASVLVVAVVGGLVGGVAARPGPTTMLQPGALVAAAAPAGSQSSSWYCTGGSGSHGPLGQSLVLLVNAGPRSVPATVDVTATRGRTRRKVVVVPSRGQLAVAPASMVHGAWLGARIDVGGGAVSASEMVAGSAGGAFASCASETAQDWYFAAGATVAGSTLRVLLYNPTADLAVVDLSFMTTAGLTAPQPFQGLVLEPWVLRSVTVGQYVQDQKQVAATVSARSGSVVATELQTVHASGVSGVAVRLGATAPERTWFLPRAEDVSGGTSEVSVFNPSDRVETVSVRARLSTGPVVPFTDKLGPHSVWTLDTAEEVRIPDAEAFAATVQATGGPGVVVDRTVAAGSGSANPQWGDDTPVGFVAGRVTRWVVPAVDTPGTSTPAARTLVLYNAGRRPVVALVSALVDSGVHRVARVTVAPGTFTTVAPRAAPLLVTADGPLAVTGDATLAAAPATELVPAVPQR